MTTTGSSPQYFVGCPAWSYKEWIGSIFEAEVEPKDLLRRYSRVFNAVEGNAFFYALPSLSTVERWMAESIEGFRFAPKFPKAISHERRLQHADEETAAFLRVLDALEHGHRLGPSFLQLPPSFNVNGFDALASYLKSLPKAFHYGVEVRHLSWFDDGPAERQLDDLLEGLGIDKVIFDSRPLFSSEEVDQGEAPSPAAASRICRYARRRQASNRFSDSWDATAKATTMTGSASGFRS